uniref:Protein toll n=1 Tax=Sipha flava TaxID=143950 RepID=A0A2S2QAM5_9HEMI
MNWLLINIVMCQLFVSQVLSNWSCLKTEKCSCDENDKEINVICNSSTVKANSGKSTIHIDCNSEQTQWEKSFDKINITELSYSDCFLFDIGIKQTISTLGINDIKKNLTLSWVTFTDRLQSYYLSNLDYVTILEISNTIEKLILTNESFQGIPNLTELYLRHNNIDILPRDVFKHLTQLVILDLGGNKISRIDEDLFYGISLKALLLDSNDLKTWSLNVQSLKTLDLSNNRLISIEMDLNNLLRLSLNKNFNLTTMPDQPFQNTSLQKIRFNYGHFTVPRRFLSSLNQLQSVHLVDLNINKVPEDMIWNSPNITELFLASNHLTEIPETFFQDSSKMKVLDLSKNQIKEIKSEFLKPLKNLEELNLSNNLILQINNYGFSFLPNLVALDLTKNNLIFIDQAILNNPILKSLKLGQNNISSLYSKNSLFSFGYLCSIEDIDLSYNNITKIGDGWLNLLKLKNLNLSRNSLNVIKIDDIQFLRSQIIADFTFNPIRLIDLSHLEIFARVQPTQENLRTITVSSEQFICDGRNYQFGRFIHNRMPKSVYKYLQIEHNMICDDGVGLEFANINIDRLTYDWKLFRDSNKSNCTDCICAYRPSDNSAIMDCSNRNLTSAPEKIISSKNINYTEVNLRNNLIVELPNYENLTIGKLDVSYNKLLTINISHLPKNLYELYLEHNDLAKIDMINLSTLTTNLKLLTMSGNLWACDCDAMSTVNFIHKYSSKIVDLENVTCASESSTTLYTLNKDEICLENYKLLNTKSIFLAIFLAIFGMLLGLLLAFYKTVIKIWISNHLLPLPTLDKNKKYDSFVSFSHKDEEFVIKHLVPELEGGSTPFKLCLHYRDWVVGDWIPSQIARSVEESRKTIIVLSSNFLESVWGLIEFRTAHMSALKDRQNRVIIILYGEISIKGLDPELKSYLSMNTYIKWGDYLFWERLKYALRHGPDLKKKNRTKILVPDKLNPHILV